MPQTPSPDPSTESDTRIFALTRGRLLDWLQSLPTPVLALGRSRLFRVHLEGTGISLEYGGAYPISGFHVVRVVKALDPTGAARRSIELVADEWDTFGWRQLGGDVRLEVKSVQAVEGRWRWRSGSGFTFYAGRPEP